MIRAGLAVLLAGLAAGCSLGGDEPESPSASSSFVTDLIRLGQERTFGRVGLSPTNGETRVIVEIHESAPRQLSPHITTGKCELLGGGVVYVLEAFRDLVSETVVDVDLDTLRRMGYVVIIGHPRFGPIGGLCADLAKSQPPSATPTLD